MSRTPLLLPPTVEEVKVMAKEIGLALAEAEEFWFYYDANGWKVGRTPMKNWKSALQGWRLRWEKRQREGRKNGAAYLVILGREYERLLRRMGTIKAQYADHQSWSARDLAEYRKLKDRGEALKKELGIMI